MILFTLKLEGEKTVENDRGYTSRPDIAALTLELPPPIAWDIYTYALAMVTETPPLSTNG